jgi:uncharacterized protein YggE
LFWELFSPADRLELENRFRRIEMKKITAFLLSILVVVGLTACNFSVNSDASKGSLSVEGIGVVKITPDIAYINIGVQSKSENVKTALDENNASAATISSTLENLGIAKEDIQTSSFNVYPMQDYGPSGMGYDNGSGIMLPKNTYQVDNIILVTVRDLTKLGNILDNTVQAGANTINSISFDVQNKDVAMKEARDKAIANARDLAEATAASAGVKLGNILNISTYSSGNPAPYFDSKGGAYAGTTASQVPISAGQLSLSMSASIVYELK